MSRRVIAIVLSVTSSVAFATLVLSHSAGAASPRAAITTSDLTFREGTCGDKGASCKIIKVGGSPFAYGSRLIFTLPLFSGGSTIGREQGECVNLRPKSNLAFCTYNLYLAAGSLSVQGTLSTSFQQARRIPVTGGTKAYEGAYGELVQELGSPARYDLHIVTP